MKWRALPLAGIERSVFGVCSALLVLFILLLHNHVNSHAYVVILGDRELGLVEDAGELETFVEDLTERCGRLYELDLELAEALTLVREYRPGSAPDPDRVLGKIRQEASFVAEAYMISVDGKELAPVVSPDELDKVVSALTDGYRAGDPSTRVVDVMLKEELGLEKRTVLMDEICSADEIVALLDDSPERKLELMAFLDPPLRGVLESRYSRERGHLQGPVDEEEVRINVQTVEEETVFEAVPFPVEHIYDEQMPATESEITTPGLNGAKKLVYEVIRENGEEVERTLLSEEVVVEPQAQVEVVGLARPPSMGTGKFVWPVQGEGTIYNGFSDRHPAIDIHIDHGTNILAADAGVVTFSGYGGSYGNYIVIYHGGYWTLYSHNSANLVSEGENVARGQVIGRVGATGRAYGAHLHFEIRVDDGTGRWHSYYQHTPVNPLKFFNRMLAKDY